MRGKHWCKDNGVHTGGNLEISPAPILCKFSWEWNISTPCKGVHHTRKGMQEPFFTMPRKFASVHTGDSCEFVTVWITLQWSKIFSVGLVWIKVTTRILLTFLTSFVLSGAEGEICRRGGRCGDGVGVRGYSAHCSGGGRVQAQGMLRVRVRVARGGGRGGRPGSCRG